MSELSKIRKDGVDYDLKDAVAREAAENAVKTINNVSPDENGNIEIGILNGLNVEEWIFTLEDETKVVKRIAVVG